MKSILYSTLFVASLTMVIAGCSNSDEADTQKTEKAEEKSKFTGIRKSYYDEAEQTIMSEVEYLNGIRNGKAIDYYKDGKIRLQGQHINGQKDGTFVWFYENGNKFKRIDYENGTLNGWDSAFYESGYHKHAVNYIDGFLKEGTMEWNRRHEVIELPATLVKEVNRIQNAGEYLFYTSFSETVKDPIFEFALIGKGTKTNPEMPFETMMFLDNSETEAFYKIPIQYGYEIVAKAVIKARGKTNFGNPFVTYKVFPVVIR